MAAEFVTLFRREPKCRDYLMGHGSSQLWAQPIKSFAINTPDERITFRLVPSEQVQRPPLWKVLFQAFRLPLLTLTWTPVVTLWLWLWLLGQGHELKASGLVSVLGSLFLLQSGVFLLNDFYDHMRGLDRDSSRRGSQVIQRGWLKAWQLRLWGWASLLAGGALGLGLLVAGPSPLELWGLVLVTALALVVLAWAPRKFRRWALPELFIVLSLGPLLTCGSSLLWLGTCEVVSAALGLAFGVVALLSFHLRSLGALISETSFLGQLGFDLSHELLTWELRLLPIFFSVSFWWLGEPILGLVLGVWTFLLNWKLLGLLALSRSPLSSALWPLRRWALLLHLSLGVGVVLVALLASLQPLDWF